MGRNNQQRRAAKKRKRRQRNPGGPGGPGNPGGRSRTHRPPSSGPGAGGINSPPVDALVLAAAQAWGIDDLRHEALLAALAERADDAVAVLDRLLARAVGELWQTGWTPADAVRVTSRQLSGAHGDLAAAVVVVDGRARAQGGQALHPRWEAHLTDLAERVVAAPRRDAGWLRRAVEVLGLLLRLEALPPTLPAPGAEGGPSSPTAGLNEQMLTRVRALLSKAEATAFDEEAEALTAKAQELIARHAIDDALLRAGNDVGEPSVRRIPVDDPYGEAKATVLTEVAHANRCRVVYDAACGWVTAFGYEADLDALELLATSLLAQATGAMARHGPSRDAAGRSRTRSFRRSFLFGFGHRVGQRLREATDGEVAATADRGRLLPVLSARDQRVDAAVAETFPQLEYRSGGVSHAGGFAAGQAAADLADLDVSAGALQDARAS